MRSMDRAAWLAQRQAATRAEYDADAAGYESDDYPRAAQIAYVARVLEACRPGGLLLDAPCGTGRYFAQIRASGRRVVGADPSAAMLAEAESKGLAERVVRVALQDLERSSRSDSSPRRTNGATATSCCGAPRRMTVQASPDHPMNV
jgi:SAM-dependent methyltransferase